VPRILRALERWLPLFACFSGAIVPVGQVKRDCLAADAGDSRDLDAQMYEILAFVLLLERAWDLQVGVNRPRP
jgi:hypothetical protein